MATIIGRKLEQKELQRLYESDEAEMAVVYGRRRVGKTFLVNQMFGSEGFAFKVTGLYKSRLPKQLENFSLALQEYSGNKDLTEPKSWTEAFDQLKDYLKASKSGKKRLLFFDELPWMDTKGSGFLAAFERFWNGWANAQQDILLILCGSATNWIINKFFKQKGGLYNRATSKIFLKPFTLNETEQYLEKQGIEWERYDIAQIYMIMGGIPYYLKQLEPNRTLADNYLKVVEALSSKHIGLTREQLIKATQLPDNGLISKVLKDLVNCGFVRAYQYYGRKTKTQTYQLADFYTMFYLSFIKSNYAQDEHFWTHSLDTPQKKAWLGYTFEQLVKDHIEQVKRALGIGSVLTKQSSWFEQGRSTDENNSIPGAQIDLLIDRRDKTINICETKFYSGEFVIDKDYSLKLRNKISTFKAITEPRKTLIATMITTFGIKHNKYSGTIQQEVVLDDLFSQP